MILRPEIPSEYVSFYHGQVDVCLKDSVFMPSSSFLHVTELTASITLNKVHPLVVFVNTDGGSDHHLTLKSVQLTLIALFIMYDSVLLVAVHTCLAKVLQTLLNE